MYSVVTSPAGDFAANAYGLSDMVGNVWEWCNWYEGSDCVIRGGSWEFNAPCARCGYVSSHDPDNLFFRVGFRAVLLAN